MSFFNPKQGCCHLAIWIIQKSSPSLKTNYCKSGYLYPVIKHVKYITEYFQFFLTEYL